LPGSRVLCALRSAVVANMRRRAPPPSADSAIASGETHSTYTFAAGGSVLTIATVLPERGLAFELVSTYVGWSDVHTDATDLALGPVGHPPSIERGEHDHEQLNPVTDARPCAYDHAQQLIERLTALGHHASLQVDELTFTALERVE
jgi:hypothetical protein